MSQHHDGECGAEQLKALAALRDHNETERSFVVFANGAMPVGYFVNLKQ